MATARVDAVVQRLDNKIDAVADAMAKRVSDEHNALDVQLCAVSTQVDVALKDLHNRMDRITHETQRFVVQARRAGLCGLQSRQYLDLG